MGKVGSGRQTLRATIVEGGWAPPGPLPSVSLPTSPRSGALAGAPSTETHTVRTCIALSPSESRIEVRNETVCPSFSQSGNAVSQGDGGTSLCRPRHWSSHIDEVLQIVGGVCNCTQHESTHTHAHTHRRSLGVAGPGRASLPGLLLPPDVLPCLLFSPFISSVFLSLPVVRWLRLAWPLRAKGCGSPLGSPCGRWA